MTGSVFIAVCGLSFNKRVVPLLTTPTHHLLNEIRGIAARTETIALIMEPKRRGVWPVDHVALNKRAKLPIEQIIIRWIRYIGNDKAPMNLHT